MEPRLTERMDAWLYPGIRDNWDDYYYRAYILKRVQPNDRVLDLGAGAGILPQMDLRAHVAWVSGIDPDPRVEDNPYLDEGCIGMAEELPWPDGHFDLVVADNVLEHLVDPVTVFREVARVLRPGGRFLVKTPNRRHYVPTLARMTPLSFHRWVAAQRGRAAEDTFPTVYRANTGTDLRRIARSSGLTLVEVDRVESRPEYLRPYPPAYLLGSAWERTVNASSWLNRFRILLVAELEKPQEAHA